MTKQSEAIADIINAVEKILKEEALGEVPRSESNIIRLDRKILTEFEERKQEKLQLHEVLKIYNNWAWRLYYVVQANQGRLKKGKIREHAIEICSIVCTIKQILTSMGPQEPTVS
jgi:hypothetical protein